MSYPSSLVRKNIKSIAKSPAAPVTYKKAVAFEKRELARVQAIAERIARIGVDMAHQKREGSQKYADYRKAALALAAREKAEGNCPVAALADWCIELTQAYEAGTRWGNAVVFA